MDFTIELSRYAWRVNVCPHTPRALERLNKWAHDGTSFPFPTQSIPSLIECLVHQGFLVQDLRDVNT